MHANTKYIDFTTLSLHSPSDTDVVVPNEQRITSRFQSVPKPS